VADIALRRNLTVFATMIALAPIFAGFSAGVIRSRTVAAPVLSRITITPVAGFIEAVEDRDEGQRLLLRIADMREVAQAERPRLVRVSIRKGERFTAGQFIAGTARLLPPPQATWPGGYDFVRDAYYAGNGAVGSMVGQVKRIDPPEMPDWFLWLASRVDEARNALTHRIAASIGGAAGGVGAALVTGKRGLIPESTNDVLRSAGIYHIVSISGLHMVLAAGTFFWLVRALLALAPGLVLSLAGEEGRRRRGDDRRDDLLHLLGLRCGHGTISHHDALHVRRGAGGLPSLEHPQPVDGSPNRARP